VHANGAAAASDADTLTLFRSGRTLLRNSSEEPRIAAFASLAPISRDAPIAVSLAWL